VDATGLTYKKKEYHDPKEGHDEENGGTDKMSKWKERKNFRVRGSNEKLRRQERTGVIIIIGKSTLRPQGGGAVTNLCP